MTHQIPATISLITWNIRRDSQTNIAHIRHLIDVYEPDLFALQEIHEDTVGDLPDGPHPSISFRTRNDGQPMPPHVPGRPDGTALYIGPRLRQSLVHTTVVPLPDRRVRFRQRYAAVAVFRTFSVASVHLAHHQLINRSQLRHAHDALPADLPAIIAGDTNMLGPSLAPRALEIANRRRSTFKPLPFFLDRIYARGLEVIDTSHICDAYTNYSDHHPVIARFRLPENHG
jgi:endonuclease/exonuclease/phosphatase family metal-dependent hydrolase